MISPPHEPTGNSKDSIWLRDLLRYVKSIALKEGVGYRRNVTSDGTTMVIDAGGGATSDPVVYYPFKIYVFPSGDRETPDATTDWRKFRVRSGVVIGNTQTPVEVSGTDGATNPDSDTVDESDVSDITVAAGTSAYWFWLDIDEASATVTLRHGTSAPSTWTLTTIPLGKVSTENTSEQVADIRQYLRTDVIIPCLNFPAE